MFWERTDRASVHKASWCLKYSVQQTAPSLPHLLAPLAFKARSAVGRGFFFFFFQTSRWGVSGERWTTLTVRYSLKFPWGPGTPPTEQTQESWLMLSRETAGINFKGSGPDKSSELDGASLAKRRSGEGSQEVSWGSSPLGPISNNGSQSQPGGRRKLSVRNFQRSLEPQLGSGWESMALSQRRAAFPPLGSRSQESSRETRKEPKIISST